MAYINPTVSEFKTFFSRDFPFGSTDASVMDSDIDRAQLQSSAFINEELFCTQEAYTLGFEYLTAHFMVMNLRASSQGINGQYSWLQSSKSVGSVSEGLSIPDRIMQNPQFAMISKTNYGAEFLFMIMPMLCGQVMVLSSYTNP